MKYTGEPYDTIKQRLEETDEAEQQVMDDDDDTESLIRRGQLGKYKAYLMRCLKQHKIAERGQAISEGINGKLQGRATALPPPLCHSSAFEYMEWTTKKKI